MIIVDESHVSLPQFRGMYNGDRARKEVLVEYGFRLPSALDNRPYKFEEFINKAPHYLFVSATPGEYELEISTFWGKQKIKIKKYQLNHLKIILNPLILIHLHP